MVLTSTGYPSFIFIRTILVSDMRYSRTPSLSPSRSASVRYIV